MADETVRAAETLIDNFSHMLSEYYCGSVPASKVNDARQALLNAIATAPQQQQEPVSDYSDEHPRWTQPSDSARRDADKRIIDYLTELAEDNANKLKVLVFEGQADEARCRELAALYLRELAHCITLDAALAARKKEQRS